MKLLAEDLFESLGKEEEQKINQFKHTSNGFHEILIVFENFYLNEREFYREEDFHLWKKVLPQRYSQNDIQLFLDYQGGKKYELDRHRDIGAFLNALIQFGKRKRYTLSTPSLPLECLEFIGDYNLKKEIVIHGNIGEYLGNGMMGGKIIIHGDTGEGVGNGMEGGLIRVMGNVEFYDGNDGMGIGDGMSGGEIHIHGDSECKIGDNMEGGRIVLYKSFGEMGDVKKGEVIFRKQ